MALTLLPSSRTGNQGTPLRDPELFYGITVG
jgi:hypothetical protein